jgi:hypothetical protein
MIKIKCESAQTTTLSAMIPFQGELKKRSEKDIAELKESLLNEGLLMPFALWATGDKHYILDGHGRRQALLSLALTDDTISTQQFPCIFIEASDENTARKALLQIISSYGKVSKAGLVQFTAPIVGYKAPIIKRVTEPPTIKTTIKDDRVIVKIKVPMENAAQLTALLAQVDWVEIL